MKRIYLFFALVLSACMANAQTVKTRDYGSGNKRSTYYDSQGRTVGTSRTRTTGNTTTTTYKRNPAYNPSTSSGGHFNPMSFDEMSAPLMRYKAAYEEMDGKINNLRSTIVRVLSNTSDDILKAELNNDYKAIQNLSKSLHTNGLTPEVNAEYIRIIDRATASIEKSNIRMANKISKMKSANSYSTSASSASSTVYNYNGVINPTYRSEAKKTRITKISFDNNYTVVEMECSNTKWCNIDKKTAIYYAGKQYRLIKAENIAYAPQTTNLQGGTLSFKLYFPVLPSSVKSFDLIENNQSTWRFYNVKIRQ